jgi:hypothetical protein
VFTDVSTLYSFDFCQFVDEITVNMVIWIFFIIWEEFIPVLIIPLIQNKVLLELQIITFF